VNRITAWRRAKAHDFHDAMENAMTGVVFTGALLFAAGLLHIFRRRRVLLPSWASTRSAFWRALPAPSR